MPIPSKSLTVRCHLSSSVQSQIRLWKTRWPLPTATITNAKPFVDGFDGSELARWATKSWRIWLSEQTTKSHFRLHGRTFVGFTMRSKGWEFVKFYVASRLDKLKLALEVVLGQTTDIITYSIYIVLFSKESFSQHFGNYIVHLFFFNY